MARLTQVPTAPPIFRQYIEAVAIAVALVLCMPILAIGAFLMRGVMAGVILLAILLLGGIALWRWLEPRLSPGCRAVAKEVALGSAFLAGIPILLVGAVAVGGVVAALVPVAAVALGIVGLFRIAIAGRHIFNNTH